ncbi:phospholipase DDHD1-like isoform X2 [Anneissia japonica]|nr:phospholipase DDHD1-like isoform X2 [Anneissia japonica]XP_033106667.1 phospholipase DDHD1-like isoform X2 [Anneissia japonica]
MDYPAPGDLPRLSYGYDDEHEREYASPTSRGYPHHVQYGSNRASPVHQFREDQVTTHDFVEKTENGKRIPPPRPPPPRQKKRTFTEEEKITKELTAQQIRWFYRDDRTKKWCPFIGYDSLQLEFKYRKVYVHGELGEAVVDRIVVRGGLYEVDITEKKCYTIYWTAEPAHVMRGVWYYSNTSEPLDDDLVREIERKHLSHFRGQKISQMSELQDASKGPKPVICSLHFKDCHVDWNSVNDVFLYSESASSRLARSIGQSLGFSKASTSGYRLQRGYPKEARLEDKPPPISHLVLVVHGVGQTMEASNITRSCSDLRRGANKIIEKLFPDLTSIVSTDRVEFLPVEWRSSLFLDGGLIDGLTPNRLKNLRAVLNSTGLDLLYYQSPLYRSEILKKLQEELNRLYNLFCHRNPWFEANNGKVSIFAHSLGSVITYDILTGWNPIHLYDQYLSHEQGQHPDLETVGPAHKELAVKLAKARKRVVELEEKLLATNQIAAYENAPKLIFKVENLFCVGSPLSVFLGMRGIRPHGNGSIDHILPHGACKRLFNIYHPSDPVAYRIEPLLLKHYTTIMPLQIHRWESSKQVPYDQIQAKVYPKVLKNGGKEMSPKSNMSDTSSRRSSSSEASSLDGRCETSMEPPLAPQSPPASSSTSYSLSSQLSDTLSGGFGSIMARWSKPDEKPAEREALEDLEKVLMRIENMEPPPPIVETPEDDTHEFDHVELEHRLDFELKESNFSNGYISALTSHTSYWGSLDVALFVLYHLYPGYLRTKEELKAMSK